METLDPEKHENDATLSSPPQSPGGHKHGASNDEMDASPSSQQMGPPDNKSVNGKRTGTQKSNGEEKRASAAFSGPVGAAAASQQPKVVQTAFIHKLYNMLEDQSIQHLISWSSSGESFLISPSSEFSKVLSSYFKHTNVSSFVRQLNMYGFHKVSDVFQTGSPDSPLWEFKHGGGNFKRGDLSGLREIKRRASRHTLIHRDSFSAAPKPQGPSVPSTAETVPETTDMKLAGLERTVHDLRHVISAQDEKHLQRCRTIHEHLLAALQLNYDMSSFILAMAGDRGGQLHTNISSLQSGIASSLEQARRDFDSIQYSHRAAFTSHEDTLSPHQRPQPDARLESIPPLAQSHKAGGSWRPLVPSTRPLGSFSGSSSSVSGPFGPAASRPPHLPIQPAHQHPLAAVSSTTSSGNSSYLGRRHTVDLSMGHATAGAPSAHWTSSTTTLPQGPSHPHHHHHHHRPLGQGLEASSTSDAPHVREPGLKPASNNHYGEYEGGSSTPPHTKSSESRWQALGGRIPFKDVFKNTGVSSPASSAPPTRRSSMANLQMVLNHADVTEKGDEEHANDEARKRQRIS